jgi:hypothetical protein
MCFPYVRELDRLSAMCASRYMRSFSAPRCSSGGKHRPRQHAPFGQLHARVGEGLVGLLRPRRDRDLGISRGACGAPTTRRCAFMRSRTDCCHCHLDDTVIGSCAEADTPRGYDLLTSRTTGSQRRSREWPGALRFLAFGPQIGVTFCPQYPVSSGPAASSPARTAGAGTRPARPSWRT